MPAALAADVPGKFDVVVNGQGYLLDEDRTLRAYGVTPLAGYGFSPTFVDRSNTSGTYGDNQQDFWLTVSQNDWSGGEGQKFYRSTTDQAKRYWLGTNADVRTAGQVTIRPLMTTVTMAGPVTATSGLGAIDSKVRTVTSVNLYTVDAAGAITDHGAHGLGSRPAMNGLVIDPSNFTYITGTTAGTVGVRKWDGASFTTWSATAADAIEYNNNTLYGIVLSTAQLLTYSAAGVAATTYTWKGADGTVRSLSGARLRAFGGQLLILLSDGTNGPELWQHNGTAPSLIASFPENFWAHDVCVASGTVFVSGSFLKHSAGSATVYVTRPAIFFYLSSTLDIIWEASDYLSSTITTRPTGPHPVLSSFDGGVVFTDDSTGNLMFYDISAGAAHSVGMYTVAGDTPQLAGCQGFVFHTRDQATAYRFPNTASIATTATVTSSLVDFDSSLTKVFRGITVDATIPTGASVDVAYQIDGVVAGSYTTLSSGITSGAETLFGSTVTGRAISVQITLNRGTSAAGPTLKRVSVRAAPKLQTYKRRNYTFLLEGRDGVDHMELRDGTLHPLDGLEMAANLNTAATASTPISITDSFGTFTGLIEPDGFELDQYRPEEFRARVRVREV